MTGRRWRQSVALAVTTLFLLTTAAPARAQSDLEISAAGRAACQAEAAHVDALLATVEGAGQPALAESLEALAACLRGARAYADARSALEHGVVARERSCPDGCGELVGALHALGGACLRAGDPRAARTAYEKALAIAERVDGPDHPDVGIILNTLGNVCQDLGDLPAARAAYKRSLTIREKLFGAESPQAAMVINGLASVAQTEGDFGRARELYERALAIDRAQPGNGHPNVTADLGNLGTLLQAMGDLPGAQAALAEALRIVTAAVPVDDPDIATAAGNLARALQARGDFVAARALFERALRIDESAMGSNHPKVATDLNNLAVLLDAQGDITTALPLFERALAIHSNRLGEEHPIVAADLHNLAVARLRRGEAAAARPLLERALAIEEKALGAEHAKVGRTFGVLARTYTEAGDLTRAAKLQVRGLVILKAALGASHPDVATALLDMAAIRAAGEDVAEARAAAERALAIRKTSLGARHPDVAGALDAVALLRWRAGEDRKAREQIIAAAALVARHVPTVLPSLSFAEQRAFIDARLPAQTSYLLSSCRDGRSLARAYGLVFRWKGLLIEALRRQTAIGRLVAEPAAAARSRQLQAVRARLAGWFEKAGTVPLAEWERTNLVLTQEKEALERELARSVSPGLLEDRLAALDLAGFRALLQRDEVLVDCYRYLFFEGGMPKEDRYAAFVVASSGSPVLVDLGPARVVDRALARWRSEVARVAPIAESWAELRRLVWNPVAAGLPRRARRILVSPDGDLARLPWHLLTQDGTSTRALTLTQIDSPRELATLRRTPPVSGGAPKVLLAGAMDYGSGAAMAGAHRGGEFEALPSTAAEVEGLSALGATRGMAVTLLTGDGPSKAAVTRESAEAGYVHLATHGFFFAERTAPAGRAGGGESGKGHGSGGRNPLVESGIALAGANVRDATTHEAPGLLTAEELVGLDLSGCRLVTLSACETGRGEEVTGQGVMGLRAAVLAAGARGIVMSLWMVPDEATEKLMRAFYSNMWVSQMPAAEALLKAQLTVRDDPSGAFREPIHWAGWVLAGEGW